MALTGAGSSFPQNNANVGFPVSGGTVQRGETREEAKTRVAAEDRAQEVLNDPYGVRAQQQPGAPNVNTRMVKVKVRKRRNDGSTESTNNNGEAGSTRRGGGAGRAGQAGGAGGNSLLNRSMNGQSSLVRASVLFQNNQAQNTQGNNTNLAVRNKMLNGLHNYIQNDYSMMKLNQNDKAFCYPPAAARQLGATIGQMVATTSKQGDKKTTSTESSTPTLSPAAYGRQKGLMRRLAAMSDPSPKMPDNLPTDYRPFESVA